MKRSNKTKQAKDIVSMSRSKDIKKIEENEQLLSDNIIKSRVNLMRKMRERKKVNIEKNKHIVINNTFEGMRAGIVDSKDKKKYIEANAETFKNLEINEQKIIFKLFLDYLQ